jgi:hypothetical protein
MADKWADYLISAVRYNDKDTHIVAVQVDVDGETVGAPTLKSRQEVAALLSKGSTICTIFKGPNGRWSQGAKVEIVKVDGEEYIRTDADKIKADNLGQLPRF